jgi:hypothetical protein
VISKGVSACHLLRATGSWTAEVATLFLVKGSLLVSHMLLTLNAIEFHFAEMISFKSRELNYLDRIHIAPSWALSVSHSVPPENACRTKDGFTLGTLFWRRLRNLQTDFTNKIVVKRLDNSIGLYK